MPEYLEGAEESCGFKTYAQLAHQMNTRRQDPRASGTSWGNAAPASSEARADQILARARAEAEQRGVPIQQVLAELGFQFEQAVPMAQGGGRSQGDGGELLAALPRTLATANAVDAVRALLKTAIRTGATDIHLEHVADMGRVRFRIDGLCVDVARVPVERFIEVQARVKILADLDVTERRRPQDGHLRFQTGGRVYDMRLATVPTKTGEKFSLRIATAGAVQLQLGQLGMDPADHELVTEMAAKPFGMVLATGPVGSGKTTTLYSCLNAIDRTRFHVCSIEDPVEVEIEGVNQVEANYFLGFDFVAGLRALLRQDPDVVLIGEVRDEETAKTAVRASMTGRLVFSTLHANQSTGAISTLRNFNIKSHQLASSLQGVIAQRLVRRTCDHCKEPYTLTDKDREMFKGLMPDGFESWAGRGCSHCHGTGYSGRLGVYEVFRVDDEVRGLIQENESERRIRQYAQSQGMVTLQQRGIEKILRGETTVEEFRRVLNF